MPKLDQIEQKFGFKLPTLYRLLAEQGRLEYHSDQHYPMPDCIWMTPEKILDFTWPEIYNPVDGLIPFAKTGDGDWLAWYPARPGLDGEPFVIKCTRDSVEGHWFAPSLAGTIYRQTLQRYNLCDPAFAEHIEAVLEVLNAHAPKPWCDTLRTLQHDPPEGIQLEDDEAIHENALSELLKTAFGDTQSGPFVWWLE